MMLLRIFCGVRLPQTVNNPRKSSYATTSNMGKTPMPMPSHKRPHGSIGQSIHGNHKKFGVNKSKGAFGIKLNWGHLKDAKADLKVL